MAFFGFSVVVFSKWDESKGEAVDLPVCFEESLILRVLKVLSFDFSACFKSSALEAMSCSGSEALSWVKLVVSIKIEGLRCVLIVGFQ